MKSSLGAALRNSRYLMATTIAMALAAMVVDMIVTQSTDIHDYAAHVTLATICCLYLGFIASREPNAGASLGFRLVPKQGWLFWLIATAVIGAVFLGLLIIATFVVPGYSLSDPQALTWHEFLKTCIIAPLVEEIIYRMMLCPPAVGLFGLWPGIVASAVLFALAHVVSGHTAPENQLGGFFLAWAFVKSETILVPIALHSIGNAFTFVL